MTTHAKTIKSRMSFLGRVRGLGSTKSGTNHFWHQRLTSVLLLILGGWFLYALFFHLSHGYNASYQFLQSPFQATCMALTLIVALYHAVLGLQIIIEDYIHRMGAKVACLMITPAVALFLGLGSLLSLFRICTQPMPLPGVL